MNKIATQLPADLAKKIASNAGIILTAFDFETWTPKVSDIIGATSGGSNFTDSPSFTDFFEDVDNAPTNTKEGKQIESREVKLSGTMVTMTPEDMRRLAAAADLSADGLTLTPRDTLADSDFLDIYYLVDYGTDSAVCLHLKNCLSTGGINIQTGNKAKATSQFEYTAHYTSENITDVPYEIVYKGEGDKS